MTESANRNDQGALDDVIYIRKSCLENAEHWLASAKILDSHGGRESVVYVLATLALEEIGKACYISALRPRESEEISSSQLRKSDHHVEKLFWALWTPSLGREIITKRFFEKQKQLAKEIHAKRLECSYVNINYADNVTPKKAVTSGQAHRLVQLCEARYNLEANSKVENISSDMREVLGWFIEASEDKREKVYVFGSDSMAKLVELGSVAEWIKWLQLESEKRHEEERLLLEEELKREKPEKDAERNPKWRMKVRWFTDSHSLRQSSLNWWNKQNTTIKLSHVTGKNGEMMVELLLPLAVPLERIWWSGLTLSHRLLVSINIATFGYFFWYMPRNVDRYFEELDDIESNSEVEASRNPSLKILWPQRALSDDDLFRTALVFHSLPKFEEKSLHDPFSHYLTGLGAIAKTDIFLQFEKTAFKHFYESLKSGMRVYGHWKEGEDFGQNLAKWRERIVPDEFDFDRLRELGNRDGADLDKLGPIRIEEAAQMKFVCDAFFMSHFSKANS